MRFLTAEFIEKEGGDEPPLSQPTGRRLGEATCVHLLDSVAVAIVVIVLGREIHTTADGKGGRRRDQETAGPQAR